MRCTKCCGLMVVDHLLDMKESCLPMWMQALRCLTCGNIVDPLIHFHRATQQAQNGGHPLEAEVQLLVVHGTLHLLGYDHSTDEEKAVMWAEQARVLERLGLSRITIQE